MPASSILSQCPTAVVVAKEKRWVWAREEAWDLAVLAGGEVVESGYPGVLLITGGDPERVASILSSYRMSFISKITPRKECTVPERLLEALEEALEALDSEEPVDVRVNLRGRSKKMYDKGRILEAVTGRLLVRRRARRAIVIEGFDDFVLFGWGLKRSCGYGCTFVW